MFIFNSLIQISSSNKARDFLCTALFFPYRSSTWPLFNLVFSAVPATLPNVNNFDLPASAVDKSWLVQKLSPWLFGRRMRLFGAFIACIWCDFQN
jgi:hypothetical protein